VGRFACATSPGGDLKMNLTIATHHLAILRAEFGRQLWPPSGRQSPLPSNHRLALAGLFSSSQGA
jgi:hypothetical protein